MKKCIVLLLSAMCSIMVYAQKDYDSILKEGKVWRMEYKLVVDPEYGDAYIDAIIMLKGDTIIDDIPFKQMCRKSWRRGEESEPTEWDVTRWFIGEKDGKIYDWLDYIPSCPRKQMDLSLNVGEEIVAPSSKFIYFAKTVSDTILSLSGDKRPRRCLSVFRKGMDDDVRRSDIWIEGIGSLKSGLTGLDGKDGNGSWPRLLRCEDNGVCIYEAEDVSADIQTVKKNCTTDAVTYDLQGRRVLQPQKGGLYIREGRKVMY